MMKKTYYEVGYIEDMDISVLFEHCDDGESPISTKLVSWAYGEGLTVNELLAYKGQYTAHF